MIVNSKSISAGAATYAEIFQQPDLWPVTLDIVRKSEAFLYRPGQPVIVTGAGTSAYAAAAVAAVWPGAQSVPTTDLLLESKEEIGRHFPKFFNDGLLVSLGRSGDSPESVAVVTRMRRLCPKVDHLAITCNADGELTRIPGVRAIVLDPRTNDRGLAMTSSFTNLVLAGFALCAGEEIEERLPTVCAMVKRRLPELDSFAQRLSLGATQRAVILAGGPMRPLAVEASLKILEMTAGRSATLPETFLGLRHGPMSFVTPDTLVLCFLSSSPNRRLYEEDLIRELRQKGLGHIVGVLPDSSDETLFDQSIPACAGTLRDELRVPFEIPFAQLLAYHLSVRAGLDPDNPSPLGAITRVVRKFVMHDDAAPV